MSSVDAGIQAIFGPPPEGIDLKASVTLGYDVVSCVVLGLALAAVALRFHIRLMYSSQSRNLGIDDYTILLGLVCTGALVATTIIAGEYGSGTHVWTTNVHRLMTLLKVVYAEPWVYAASVTSTKVSILLLYRRLFYVTSSREVSADRTFYIMLWVAIVFTASYPLIMWTVMAVACRPVSFFWRRYAGASDGVCIDVLSFFLAFGIVNMINDLIVLAVPIPRILKLRTSNREKISIMGILLLGSFVCVASGVRIYYLTRLMREVDVTMILGPAFGWSSLEPSIAIISACLPTFAPLFRGLRKRSASKLGKSGQGSHSSYLRSGRGGHIPLQDCSQSTLDNKYGRTNVRIVHEDSDMSKQDSFDQGHGRIMARRDSTLLRDMITVDTDIEVVTTDKRVERGFA
ncbi:hypothetical protein AUEXF2481DRAFT_9521 [Aureobasidium subglaciale EXF-2481]|uniref:Rhodopsin domain-containing protein n=1 Tax=Aureobasidium subglaciale (strain EXF-2481) TaxID=1043005 RepID=A0A074XXQ8_AURSE|nr:uncharacterized protein AUEXF2481DRAFT_9521 [Aureobasidium subglaciale EXF-2481]KAI5197320.1 hypothetical protein E4T38_08068 [Aureobasidium subglaciale]KAI5216224.1 hypothetical protein E4T40_08078 [Aureobasidium subglaciale]KAI5219404.1 hypothetical protein E4T41_07993 [Aureobasidium subglaciale]KAI5256902.1 hypothetical protein E4T46_07969 [Aureobasidium subglaciale]KEQ90363.1 hypothetical protein AUEXF2481DRAFT_9521 [Aureobasidium subglaciale EXF-2481]